MRGYRQRFYNWVLLQRCRYVRQTMNDDTKMPAWAWLLGILVMTAAAALGVGLGLALTHQSLF